MRFLVRACLLSAVPVVFCCVSACASAGGGTAANEGGYGAVGNGGNGGTAGVSHGGWPEGGPAGSGGSAAGSGGSGGCSPQCSGRVCGPDGCGHVCGHCSTNETCTSQGQCISTCTPTWETDLPAVPMGAVAGSSTVYMVGTKSSSAWATAVSFCQGNVANETTLSVPGATSSSLRNVILAGSSLYAVGDVVTATDPGDGLWVRLVPTTLSPAFMKSLYGTTASDEDWRIVQTPTGFWMGGTSNSEANGFGWGIKGLASGKACGFRIGGTDHGAIHAIAANGSTVYEIRGSNGSLYIDSFDDTACATTGPCPCTASATAGPITIGSASNDGYSALFEGGSLYVAGFGANSTSTDHFGFVLRLDASGKLLATYKWDPSALFDGFVSMTTDGQALYIGGAQGWDSAQATTASATAVIQKLPLGFSNNVAPTWIRSLGAYDVAWAIAAEPASAGDGLFVAGERQGAGFVMRCQKSNVCPQ